MIRALLVFALCLTAMACASKPKASVPPPAGPTDGVILVSLWYRAARLGDVETLKRLSEDREKQPIDRVDGNGVTALMVASRNGQLEAVRFLLESGADAKRADKDWQTALGYAVLGSADDDKRRAVTKLLLEHGADPFLPDGFGAVPVREIVSFGYLDIVKSLTFTDRTPCDRVAPRKGDDSIVEVARKSEQEEVVQYLQSIGCR